MVVRIDFELSDVTFMRDYAEAHIVEIKEKINKIVFSEERVTAVDNVLLDIHSTNLEKWKKLYNKYQKTLKRKGWD